MEPQLQIRRECGCSSFAPETGRFRDDGQARLPRGGSRRRTCGQDRRQLALLTGHGNFPALLLRIVSAGMAGQLEANFQPLCRSVLPVKAADGSSGSYQKRDASIYLTTRARFATASTSAGRHLARGRLIHLVRLQDALEAIFSGDGAMTRALTKGVALAFLFANLPAWAQQVFYIGNTMGVGSGRCATYKMDMEIVIDGTAVNGRIKKQQGRPDRNFNATLAAGGMLKTKVVVGGDESMDVIGTINDKEARVLLDGYCKFDFRLTPK